jgi:hypothetical protein
MPLLGKCDSAFPLMKGSFANTDLNGHVSDAFLRGPKIEGSGTFKLGTRQANFAAALLDPERPVPPGLIGPDGKPSTRRFNVYRNNVVASLTRVLRDAFPATARIVGDEFFAAMSRDYIAAEPPVSPMLFDYGGGFADFIYRFRPAADLPYLRDVARIERGWIEAYHAAEADSIRPAVFAQVSPEDLPNLRVALHPSLCVVRSRFPALTIWQMNINVGMTESVNLAAGGEDVLIVRSVAQVELRELPPGGADFLQALCNGRSMLDATKMAMTAHCRFDLSGNLSGLMGAGAFIGIDLAGRPTLPSIDGRAS